MKCKIVVQLCLHVCWLLIALFLFRLAASIAAEESESLTKIASTSGAKIPLNSEGDDEDEEMILVSVFYAK